jgi:hypothetical protein
MYYADMLMTEMALSHTEPLGIKPARFRPDDQLLAFLESLGLCRLWRPREPLPAADSA